jgi:hypothetical protein
VSRDLDGISRGGPSQPLSLRNEVDRSASAVQPHFASRPRVRARRASTPRKSWSRNAPSSSDSCRVRGLGTSASINRWYRGPCCWKAARGVGVRREHARVMITVPSAQPKQAFMRC